LLALKLLLVPAFLAAVSLAGRRWGPSVAGWLAGLPVVTGPILLILSIERGAEFAAVSATASLLALVATASFSLTYAWMSLRSGWLVCILAATGAWLTGATVLAQAPGNVWLAAILTFAALTGAFRLFPRLAVRHAPRALPKGELAIRMAAGAALTLLVTGVASGVGPAWTGLLAMFPVLGTVLAVFSHRAGGSAFVVELLRAMTRGQYASALFCLSLALLLPEVGLAAAFAAAVALALAAHRIGKSG
jgi:hypothetical protein